MQIHCVRCRGKSGRGSDEKVGDSEKEGTDHGRPVREMPRYFRSRLSGSFRLEAKCFSRQFSKWGLVRNGFCVTESTELQGEHSDQGCGGILNQNLEGNAVSPPRARTMLGSELF